MEGEGGNWGSKCEGVLRGGVSTGGSSREGRKAGCMECGGDDFHKLFTWGILFFPVVLAACPFVDRCQTLSVLPCYSE